MRANAVIRELGTHTLVAISLFFLVGSGDPQADSTLKLRPNEAGRVMVLMYHGIGSKDGVWVRSRQSFQKDLETLYEKGYRPVSLPDYVQNRIAIEAGYTPVILTFDDGRLDNFRMMEEVMEEGGKPVVDQESAVGILEAFHREHPDFPLEATFFLYGKNPFKQQKWIEYKLNYLISKGMDIGNHTTGHDDLALKKNQDAARIQRVIGAQARFLEEKITEHPDYRVNTYALCHGGRPKGASLLRYLKNGMSDGHEYINIAILNVGSGPALSPVDRDFNQMSIPRIRASDKGGNKLGISAWIRHFDNHPEDRYISDGDPSIVTVPRELSEKIDPDKLNGADVVLYGP
jgi:hypothetical protein